VAESYLPPRTVRYALDRLKKEGILEERLYYKDARQCLYGVKTRRTTIIVKLRMRHGMIYIFLN